MANEPEGIVCIGETGFEPATARPPAGRCDRHIGPDASASVPASPALVASETSDDALGTTSGIRLALLQQAQELVAGDSGIGEDSAERATLDVLAWIATVTMFGLSGCVKW